MPALQPRMSQEEMKENENEPAKKSARKNLFGKLTPEDKQEIKEKLQELSEEGRKKLEKYQILGVIKPEPAAEPEEENNQEAENDDDEIEAEEEDEVEENVAEL